MEFLHQPASSNRLGEFLLDNLRGDWERFRAAVAFVKRSGTKHIVDELKTFSQKHPVEILAGINHGGTSKEGLDDLLQSIAKPGRVIIFNNPKAYTFHPKVYLFKSVKAADLLIGSGNLTEGGIYSNYEASVRLRLNLDNNDQAAFLKTIEDVLDSWANLTTGCARVLDPDFLTTLVARGVVPVEVLAAPEGDEPPPYSNEEVDEEHAAKVGEPEEPLFSGRSEPRAPTIAKSATAVAPSKVKIAPKSAVSTPLTSISVNRGFVMVLQNTDVGKGQTTAGTSARSPEIFIPLKARGADPNFWGWPDKFVESPTKYDRAGVIMRLGTQDIVVNMMCWKLKKDFRLRHEALRSGGSIGDILRIETAPTGSGFEYLVEFVPQGTTMHPVYLARCTEAVPHSPKMFGYY
ncbi:MAG: hypothetical protein FD139_3569 [Methylocystaceae bacterium]|nr:MAG: hypothetical protein FD172_3737 [Methylocystaceae bacterium]TXT42521.1 MAG: hypothetical protein FD139_3569 [Methylocystaceae bacterium]